MSEITPAPETRFRPVTAPPHDDAGTRLRPVVDPGVQQAHACVEATPPRLCVGQVLGGRYQLERQLGEGGMGMVFQARDLQVAGEYFAIKVLKPELRAFPHALELLQEEVRKTRALHHPNIIGAYSLNVDPAGIYMLMEYLEGKTVDALIGDDFGRGMPPMRAWPIIKDVGAALACAHDHNVIHSDLKPANIFVTSSGTKLLDFGVARAVRVRGARFDTGTLNALTPAYASCEMLDGQTPDPSDDIYAFACVIYEMLSGKHPFDHRDALAARSSAMVPAPLAVLTRDQNKALAQAMAFNRAERTASVEALLAGLDTVTTRRIQPLLWISVAALICVITGAVVWNVAGKKRPERTPVAPSSTLPPATATADLAVARIAQLQTRAQSLHVDQSQAKWQAWVQQFSAARQHVAAGDPQAPQLLKAADAGIQELIRSGTRFTKVGSLPAEITEALSLCAKTKRHCSAADFNGEAPRMVQLAPFDLDAGEVTNAQFDAFTTATGASSTADARGLYGYTPKGSVLNAGESWRTLRDALSKTGVDASSYPVRGIDFAGAAAYCQWHHQRLPSGDEWEFVARGPTRRIFIEGNAAPAPRPPSANPLPVADQRAIGLFGNRGLGGSLWEWVDDGDPDKRSLRGASWRDSDPVDQRLATRRVEDPSHAFIDSGFRCATTADTWPETAR